MDEDGETAFFRGASIALAAIPLKAPCEEEIFYEKVKGVEDAHASTVH